MPKRNESELEEYLAKKLGKHLNSLTDEQVIALRKQIAAKKLTAVHHVRDQFNKLAEVGDREREIAAQRMVQSASDQVALERLRHLEANIADSALIVEIIHVVGDSIESLAQQDFMDAANSSALALEHVAAIRRQATEVHGGILKEIRTIIDVELPRWLGRNQGEVTFALDRVEDKIEALAGVYYKAASETVAATREVTQALRSSGAGATEGEPLQPAVIAAVTAACDSALRAAETAGKPVPGGLSQAFRAFRNLKAALLDTAIDAKIQQRLQQRKAASKGSAKDPSTGDGPGPGPEGSDGKLSDKSEKSDKSHKKDKSKKAAIELDPIVHARRACQHQIAHLTQALRAVALVVDDVAPAGVAYLIHDLLLDAGTKYFKMRLIEAIDRLDVPAAEGVDEQALQDRLESEAWSMLASHVVDGSQLVAALTEALDGVADVKVGPTLMGKIREIVTKRLIRYLPSSPRLGVNANRIRADVAAILNRPGVRPVGDPSFEHQQPRRPSADDAGTAVRRYLMDWVERDSEGSYYWVEMAEGGSGKLYVEGAKLGQFTAVPGAGGRFPEAMADGTPIDSVVSAATGMADFAWSVHIKDLVGYVDADATTFSASRPHEIADWSSRRITVSGYAEGNQVVSGRWTRVPNRDGTFEFYLFVDEAGARQWAAADSRVANTEATVLKVFAARRLEIVRIDKIGFTSAPALR